MLSSASSRSSRARCRRRRAPRPRRSDRAVGPLEREPSPTASVASPRKCVSRWPAITVTPGVPGAALPSSSAGANARLRPEAPASTVSGSPLARQREPRDRMRVGPRPRLRRGVAVGRAVPGAIQQLLRELGFRPAARSRRRATRRRARSARRREPPQPPLPHGAAGARGARARSTVIGIAPFQGSSHDGLSACSRLFAGIPASVR